MNELRRESPYPMVSIDEAQQLITAHCAPLGVEPTSSLHADGRVLAEDVFASDNIPDVPKSAMDGYALRAADGLSPRRVLAELTAGGSGTVRVEAGTAVRIMTGAPIPPGADAMIQVELTEEHNGVLQIEREVPPGFNIHTVGQDIAAGQLVLARGTTLGAAEVGLLATVGVSSISVFRRPRVAVLATGDEVVEPDAPREVGGVRDSNRYALLAAAREAGCEVVSLGIARDDYGLQREAILRGLEGADVLLTSGGVSMGTRDLIKPILAELGQVHFGRIAFKPGKPTTFASVGGKLVFGLPGYPASSLVSFEVFVRPALRRMQGDTRPERPLVQVRLLEPIKPSPDRPEYQRITIFWQDGQLVARSTGGQGSSRLMSLHGANGLLLVPAGTAVYPVGAELGALLVGSLVV
ncbi:MAG: molybdopterin molybdotransferase MoeA [Chloroflexaceae bacterium]|jgi:molybdopterin molybdotransferase|nr:molybdopterin molybdotransferase MoeA [Chloroflexaceae bacterium]